MKIEKFFSKRQTDAGFSLIELIMALAISLIGLTGGFTLYRSAHQTVNATQTAAEIQSSVRKVLELMAQDLHESSVDTIDLSVSGAISFASARNANSFVSNSDGTPDWKNAIVYFVDDETNTLCRYVEAKDDWSANFNTASALTSDDVEQLTPHVTGMSFTLNDNVLTVALAFSKHIESAGSDVFTSQILIRN
jgi:prepilin-type N-terminal cleavage/methylation domain-containing protein